MKKEFLRMDGVLAGILALSALLALLAPQQFERDRVFGMDFGIPTKWYGSPSDMRPDCAGVPENSIGLDFLNIDSCLRSLGTGPELYMRDCPCDPFRRPYTYPPLMTFLFSWVLWVSTPTAVKIWTSLVFALVFLNAYLLCGFWRPDVSPRRRALVSLLLTFSYPSVFSYQRGNHDVLVLSLLTAGAFLFREKHWFRLGALLALAGLLKIYPAPLFVSMAFVLGILAAAPATRKEFLPAAKSFLLGGAVTLAAGVGVFFDTTVYYLRHMLPL